MRQITIGDNSNDPRLKAFIERIERLNEEKAELSADITEVFKEAKSAGYDAKVMREVIKLRKMKPNDRAEREALLDNYKAAIGMLADTPLGQAALSKAAG